MELNEARVRLANWAVGIDFDSITSNESKKELLEGVSEAINTVLQELVRLQKANETLNGFIEWGTNPFFEEVKEEMTAEEFLRIRDMECIKYEECDDKCKFKRGGECVALCRIAVQIAKEIKEEKDEIN